MKARVQKLREHPLDEWLSFEAESILKFRKIYPDLWEFFGEIINVCRAMPFVIGQQSELTEIEMLRLFLWQKVLHYQVQSLFLLLKSQLDAGYALLRLAAELARDIARVGDNDEMFAIWSERESKPNQYKKLFKFASNSPDEEAVFNVYKFASKFGVHGHITDTMFSETVGAIGESDSMMSLAVSDYGVLDGVHMWMLALLPMHHICAKTFISKYYATRPEIFLTLRDYEVTMNSFAETVSKSLESRKIQRTDST